VTLFPGDEIVVALNEGVKVTGNVLLTSEIPYDKRKRFGITNAVGVDSKAGRKKAYIIYQTVKPLWLILSFLFARIPK
jgi:ribosomal protein L13